MRNVGLDVHKKYTHFTELDERGLVLRQGKIGNEELPALFSDGEARRVVLEAGRNWYYVYELLESLVDEVKLAHPLRTKAIASAKVKTDKVDSKTLADLLRTDYVPMAYIAPVPVRELRELLRYRVSLTGLRTAVKNKVHALLAKRGLSSPCSDLFGKKGRRWLEGAPLPPVYRQALEGYLCVMDALTDQIDQVTVEIRRRAVLSADAKLLATIPGIGVYSALLILAEVGDIRRFPDRRHLVSYAGLAPVVRASGGRTRCGHISKQGSPWLRWILVQSAHIAARYDPQLKDRFRDIAYRRGAKVATVALARHLLRVVYQVLKTQKPYHASAGAAPVSP